MVGLLTLWLSGESWVSWLLVKALLSAQAAPENAKSALPQALLLWIWIADPRRRHPEKSWARWGVWASRYNVLGSGSAARRPGWPNTSVLFIQNWPSSLVQFQRFVSGKRLHSDLLIWSGPVLYQWKREAVSKHRRSGKDCLQISAIRRHSGTWSQHQRIARESPFDGKCASRALEIDAGSSQRSAERAGRSQNWLKGNSGKKRPTLCWPSPVTRIIEDGTGKTGSKDGWAREDARCHRTWRATAACSFWNSAPEQDRNLWRAESHHQGSDGSW